VDGRKRNKNYRNTQTDVKINALVIGVMASGL